MDSKENEKTKEKKSPSPLNRVLIVLISFIHTIICTLSASSILLWFTESLKIMQVSSPTPGSLYFTAFICILLNLLILKVLIDILVDSMILPLGVTLIPQVDSFILFTCLVLDFLQVFFFHSVTRPHIIQATSSVNASKSFQDWIFYSLVAFHGPILRMTLTLILFHQSKASKSDSKRISKWFTFIFIAFGRRRDNLKSKFVL